MASFVVVLSALGDPPGRAIPSGLDREIATAHFVVHFTTLGTNAVSAAATLRLAEDAERAYAVEVGTWGWPPPVDDGDGKTDIYIGDVGQPAGAAGVNPDTTAAGHARASAYVVFSLGAVDHADRLVPHELMHVLQHAAFYDAPALAAPSPAYDFYAGLFPAWASDRITGVYGLPAFLAAPALPLDCVSPLCRAWWPAQYAFPEFLAERFGPQFLAQVWEQSSRFGLDVGLIPPLEAALALRRTSLPAVFNAYTRANLTLAYTHGAATLRAYAQSRVFRARVGRYPSSLRLVIDHLATNYVQFAAPRSRCRDTTLAITVTRPVGSVSAPALLVRIGRRSRLLSAAATTRRVVLEARWSCGARAILAVPNPSPDRDDAPFTVHAVNRTG